MGVWAGINYVVLLIKKLAIRRNSLRIVIQPDVYSSRFSLRLSLRGGLRVILWYLHNYSIILRSPKWRRIFKNNATFRWSFLALLAQVLYTLGYYEVIQVWMFIYLSMIFLHQAGFMPSDYKTSYYRPILLKYGIDVSNVEFGYLAMILRVCSSLIVWHCAYRESKYNWKIEKPSVDPSQPDIWQNDAVVSVIGAALFAFTAVIIFICCFLILHQLRIAKYVFALNFERNN